MCKYMQWSVKYGIGAEKHWTFIIFPLEQVQDEHPQGKDTTFLAAWAL